MALILITPPILDPITLEDAKLHLRVDTSDDDTLILDEIKTARRDVEAMSLHALITQTWDLFLDAFPAALSITLPLPPLQSVTGVFYTPDGGSEQTFAAANYIVDINSTPGRIYLKTTTGGGTGAWPGDILLPIQGVRIRFICGFGDNPSDVDERLVQAVKLMVGHYYENREGVLVGQGASAMLLPQGVSSLCNDLRMKVRRF